MAKKKSHRTTLRSSKGKKLYAVRDAGGQFKDIQTYKRSHALDMKQTSKAEAASRAVANPTNDPNPNVSLPGVSLPIPTPGVASQASPLTIPNLGSKKKAGSKTKAAKKPAKPAKKKAAAKPAAMKAAGKSASKKKAKAPAKKKKKR